MTGSCTSEIDFRMEFRPFSESRKILLRRKYCNSVPRVRIREISGPSHREIEFRISEPGEAAERHFEREAGVQLAFVYL
jgi:hypothetical protein